VVKAPILVLGVGNPLLGDEGVGPRAIEELSRRFRFSPEIDLLDGGTAGLSLLPRILEAERLLVLDAIQAGEPPGSLLALDGKGLASGKGAKLSPHQVGLGEVLALTRFRGGPREVVVMGVEPETLNLQIGLSPKVAAALEKLIRAAVEQLALWGVRAVLKPRRSPS
jgi:hydrogenase maturation protease